MSYIVIFNETDDDVVGIDPSADTSQYEGKPHVVVNPDLTAVKTLPEKFWKLSGGHILPMTLAEQNAKDIKLAASVLMSKREAGKKEITDRIILRALADVIKDEINILRDAVFPSLPARTLTQIKNAINAKIDSGNVDT